MDACTLARSLIEVALKDARAYFEQIADYEFAAMMHGALVQLDVLAPVRSGDPREEQPG